MLGSDTMYVSRHHSKNGGGVEIGGWGLGVGLHSVLSTVCGAYFFRDFYNAAQNQPSTLNPQPAVHSFPKPKSGKLNIRQRI